MHAHPMTLHASLQAETQKRSKAVFRVRRCLPLQPASGLTPPTGSQAQCHLAAQSQDRFLRSNDQPRARKRTSTTEGRIGASAVFVSRFGHHVRMPAAKVHSSKRPARTKNRTDNAENPPRHPYPAIPRMSEQSYGLDRQMPLETKEQKQNDRACIFHFFPLTTYE
jgi:hypothetical protein